MKVTLLLLATYFSICLGIPLLDTSGRVVGGDRADEGQFPYVISLRRGDDHMCGGSIINEYWILTAAHCLVGQLPILLSVRAGSIELHTGGDVYDVEDIIPHPRFSSWTTENDIGLIKLASPLVFSDFVQPIALETEDVGNGEPATLCGWGYTSYPGSVPNYLQFVELETISLSQCKSLLDTIIYDSQICTLTHVGEGACSGDSGGPLVSNGKQIGVVSWGQPCAIGYPDVFSRVSSFIDWIQSNIN